MSSPARSRPSGERRHPAAPQADEVARAVPRAIAPSAAPRRSVLSRKGKGDGSFAAPRRTPYLQGQIDGMCGFYGIVNAFQCLFPASFTDDDAWELMVAMCEKLA